ncbi:hypothetical protein [Serratia marcescens]|uniref:hypothetical protein n=1 Tax=Serratia marcescens TaxID=615 RepID=UPI001F40849E|nr:hypothetical protein [Serratia marcescens]UIM55637.1 hypothetical protein LXH15_00375 [Serratia marcescens]
MNRIVIFFSALALIILGSIFLYLNHSNWKPFRCNTHISSNIFSKDGHPLVLNMDINIITAHEGSSELIAVGSLKGEDKNYVIARRIFITMRKSDFTGFTKTTIDRQERRPIDNVPEALWEKYVLPETPGVEFYMETKKLKDNLYLIKGLSNPHFVCALEKD